MNFPFADQLIKEAKKSFKETNPGMDEESINRCEPWFIIGYLKPILESLNKEKQDNAFDKLPNLKIDKLFDWLHEDALRNAPTNPYPYNGD